MVPDKGGYDDIRRMRDLLMIFDGLINMNRQQEAKQVLQRINSLNQCNPEDFRIHLITWNGGTSKIGTPIVNNLGDISILRDVLDDWLAIAEPYANSYLANFCRLNRARLKEVAAMANKFKGRGNMMESKKIRLNETQLKRIIKEAIGKALDEPIGTDYGEFTDVMEFLTPFFDAWGWKYAAKLEDHKTANCLLIRFKHRLGASTCARLCAEINSHLEWSKFSNYKCLWGVNEKTHTFSFELWEKHYDNGKRWEH